MSKYYDTAKRYLWPWVLVPIFIIYGGDFITDMITVAQVLSFGFLLVLAGGILLGAWLALEESLEKPRVDLKLFHVLPTVMTTKRKMAELLEKVEE